jgi:hypothetical protein
MITEVNNQGTERNRQPEFFFNGMIGHVRPRGGGYVDSWAEATRLSNYWRRFYNIDQVYEDQPGIRKRISLPGILKTINTTMLP